MFRAIRLGIICAAVALLAMTQVQYYSSYNRFAASMEKPGLRRARRMATPTGYAISAVPDHFVIGGSKTYFSDQSMGIYVHNGQEPATVNDPLLSGGRSTLRDPHPGRRLE